MNILVGKSYGGDALTSADFGYSYGYSLNSLTSATTILPLSPVPSILERSNPFSAATFLARGLANSLDPSLLEET